MTDSDALQNLLEAKEILDSFDIEFWLDGGTLLGIYRDKKLIPGETKLDLLMWRPESYYTLVMLKKEFKKKGFSVYYDLQERGHCFAVTKRGYELAFGLLKDEEGYCFLKFYVPKGRVGEVLNGALKKLKLRTNALTKYVCLALPTRYFKKLTDIEFMGKIFKSPSGVENYLEFRYGKDWRVRKENYTWFKEDGAVSNLKKRPLLPWNLVIGLSLFMIIAFCFDVGISYYYFLSVDSTHFINHEQNRYVANCFLNNTFPILYFLKIPLYVIPLFISVLFFGVMKNIFESWKGFLKYITYIKWSKHLFICYNVCIGFASITGGITWFDKTLSMNILNGSLTLDSNIFLWTTFVPLFILLLKLVLDEKKEIQILKIK